MHIHASFLIPKKGGLYHLLSFFHFLFLTERVTVFTENRVLY